MNSDNLIGSKKLQLDDTQSQDDFETYDDLSLEENVDENENQNVNYNTITQNKLQQIGVQGNQHYQQNLQQMQNEQTYNPDQQKAKNLSRVFSKLTMSIPVQYKSKDLSRDFSNLTMSIPKKFWKIMRNKHTDQIYKDKKVTKEILYKRKQKRNHHNHHPY